MMLPNLVHAHYFLSYATVEQRIVASERKKDEKTHKSKKNLEVPAGVHSIPGTN